MAEFDSQWMNAWQDEVNNDPALAVFGRYFTDNFLLGFGDKEYLVSVREGRIERVTDNLSADTPWTFGLRGPRESWEKFIQQVPPPMYNDIWAMAHPLHKQLVIEGNTLPFWQNLRALTRMLSLMRQV